MTLYTLLGLLVVGAILPPGNVFHSAAVAFDAFVQDLAWNDTLGVTISSRAGLAARRGLLWPQKAVNTIMGSSTHCVDAIAADIQRAQAALKLLEAE